MGKQSFTHRLVWMIKMLENGRILPMFRTFVELFRSRYYLWALKHSIFFNFPLLTHTNKNTHLWQRRLPFIVDASDREIFKYQSDFCHVRSFKACLETRYFNSFICVKKIVTEWLGKFFFVFKQKCRFACQLETQKDAICHEIGTISNGIRRAQ